jgi:hypothetical protein
MKYSVPLLAALATAQVAAGAEIRGSAHASSVENESFSLERELTTTKKVSTCPSDQQDV